MGAHSKVGSPQKIYSAVRTITAWQHYSLGHMVSSLTFLPCWKRHFIPMSLLRTSSLRKVQRSVKSHSVTQLQKPTLDPSRSCFPCPLWHVGSLFLVTVGDKEMSTLQMRKQSLGSTVGHTMKEWWRWDGLSAICQLSDLHPNGCT